MKKKKKLPAAAARIVLTKTCNKGFTFTSLMDSDHRNGEKDDL